MDDTAHFVSSTMDKYYDGKKSGEFTTGGREKKERGEKNESVKTGRKRRAILKK